MQVLVLKIISFFSHVNVVLLLDAEANRLRDAQSVRSRLALRKRLECKSFGWYLENVWPENFFPGPNRFFGKVLNDARRKLILN